jgi:superfamily II RNA helicase
VTAPLADQLFFLPPRAEDVRASDVLDRFLDYVKAIGLTLYPAQEEAILEIVSGKNVILNTPTGSGKSLVATAMHFLAMATGERSYYTCPIKALVSEKFFALCNDFGPDNVGMMTGDATVNRDAPIICCTAEILANIALREGARADVRYAILDEFHYYADRDRGVAWQLPLLALPQARFLLMSATLGPTDAFEAALTKLTGVETATVRSTDRPVPLDFTYAETPLHETILKLVNASKAPIYVVNFTQRACAEEAQNLMSTDYSTKEEKRAITEALHGVRFDSPYGKEVQKFVKHGVGIHHAGLLPKYRRLVERLAQRGMLKVICGTDTLGVGVNVPIRTVLFTKLCKFDGEKTAILSVRDFQQIAGRAGRKGFDSQGSVVAQAPEHVIENARLEAKSGNDAVKKRKFVRKKPPDKGYVHWDKATFDRLVTGQPEPLVSRFSVSHGMLINVLSRQDDGGCKALARLIKASHERTTQKRVLGRTAMQMFTSLRDAGVIEVDERRHVRVNADLQEDFSLNHALSLYLVETIGLIPHATEGAPDRDADQKFALDLLSVVESILENPELVLMKQLDKIKTLKMAEMKAAGIEFDERIAELDKLDYPKPNRDFAYDTFNAFAKKHPWVQAGRGDNIRPKSIAREMYETFATFPDYVREYALERGEGLLLRYLSDVYKTLVQSVPAGDKTREVDEIVTYFGAIVRAVDSSLLDEWERMRSGTGDVPAQIAAAEVPGEADVTANAKELTVLVRNALFALLRAVARRDYAAAAAMLDGQEASAWTPERLAEALVPFWAEHASIRTDAHARSPENTRVVSTDDGVWRVQQVIADTEDANDWAAFVTIDLARSREAARPVMTLERIGI